MSRWLPCIVFWFEPIPTDAIERFSRFGVSVLSTLVENLVYNLINYKVLHMGFVLFTFLFFSLCTCSISIRWIFLFLLVLCMLLPHGHLQPFFFSIVAGEDVLHVAVIFRLAFIFLAFYGDWVTYFLNPILGLRFRSDYNSGLWHIFDGNVDIFDKTVFLSYLVTLYGPSATGSILGLWSSVFFCSNMYLIVDRT